MVTMMTGWLLSFLLEGTTEQAKAIISEKGGRAAAGSGRHVILYSAKNGVPSSRNQMLI
jgi:hypothetical protein